MDENYRIGLGKDSHAFLDKYDENKPLILGGVHFEEQLSLQANSDGDVILHAIFNAISQALGDRSIGYYADVLCKKQGVVNSQEYLPIMLKKMSEQQYIISNMGITIEAKIPQFELHFDDFKESLSQIFEIDKTKIGLNFTSGEGLTAVGQGLNTIMHKINLYDVLTIRKISQGITFKCNWDTLTHDASNTILKAYQILINKIKRNLGVEVVLEKKIPVQSGLGGGSSDAASFILLMQKMYNLDLSVTDLNEIGVAVGIDVPFFLQSSSAAYATHYGEKIKPLKALKKQSVRLIIPELGSSSHQAYKNIQLENCGKNTQLTKNLLSNWSKDMNFIYSYFHNDFIHSYLKQYPYLKTILNYSKEKHQDCFLTGSGSVLFFFELQKRYINAKNSFYTIIDNIESESFKFRTLKVLTLS